MAHRIGTTSPRRINTFNQAVVTDSVVTGKNNEAVFSAKLLAAITDKPMEIIEAEKQNKAPVGAGGTKVK